MKRILSGIFAALLMTNVWLPNVTQWLDSERNRLSNRTDEGYMQRISDCTPSFFLLTFSELCV